MSEKPNLTLIQISEQLAKRTYTAARTAEDITDTKCLQVKVLTS